MKKHLVLLALLAAFLATYTVSAQEEVPVIGFEEVVTGEITNRNFEVPYKFAGKQGDVVIIEMSRLEALSDLDRPALILLDTSSRMMGQDDGYGNISLAAKLPADGEYTILATRSNGRAGDSVGRFSLTIHKPPVLVVGKPIFARITSEQTHYYTVETPGTFGIEYVKRVGRFYPAISVQQVTTDCILEEVASLQGDALIGGKLVLESQSAYIAETFVVVVKEALWSWNWNAVSASYEVSLTQ